VSLSPGQSTTVTFTLGPAMLAFFGQDMQRIVEPGFFTVSVGTSSERVESARFEITGTNECATLVLSPRVLGWLPDRLAVRAQNVAGTCRARGAQ
jgi:hypothetical protein